MAYRMEFSSVRSPKSGVSSGTIAICATCAAAQPS